MKRFGHVLLSSIVMIMVLAAVPVYAASSTWTLDMSLCMYNGKVYKQFHHLADGKNGITVSGTVTTKQKNSGASVVPREITVFLREDDGHTNNLIGSFKVKPSSAVGGTVQFSQYFPGANSVGDPDGIGEYYLVWSKGANDYWRITGTGTISN
ncbi:hypothetical protein NQ117_00240 [Paenibacillus sp. SC116]|uniref:hypothetical protein n=1 Tax=Paenibacillus sp. SC116 TaxID=2968986 RepID=UPI00215A3722|nr:hypothetical protein [Paenibacillus sp. SC116]MCR8842102.1 hypothetical protein [Paenibacillus sp. SC116]